VIPASEYALWLAGERPAPTGTDTSSSDDPAGTADAGTSSSDDTAGTTDAGTSTSSGTTVDGMTTYEPTGGGLEEADCLALCQRYTAADDWLLECMLAGDAPADHVHVVCTWTTGCDGRRHACLGSTGDGVGGDPLTAWLARAAHDEAGSVHAFVALHRELAEHGAPMSLLRRVRRAADDERRHAAAVDRLIRARGGRWRRPRVRPIEPRSLVMVAIENAVEGCVRETWAALSAAHQAARADDLELRAALVAIAVDERRHAELAWAIDRWVHGRLTDVDRAAVVQARTAAARSLRRGLAARRLPPAVIGAAGVPDGRRALGLLDGLAATLWPTVSS
jgi:hypothetical protein